ncbi:MAG: 2-phospho-L-lactate transferase [Candidatus Binatia bacterium]
MERVTVLAGGVGAARFLRGLSSLLDPRRLTVIVNTGDDESFFGLHVSPDVDTVIYTLAGTINPVPGWGIKNDTFSCLGVLGRFYDETWFRLGDKDLATHIFRTDALRRGKTLTEVTAAIAKAYGIRVTVLPMTDVPVRTFVEVARRRPLPFQRYLVHGGGHGQVKRITLRGARRAHPARGALAAVRQSTFVIIPPSNPFVSIGPIMALRGMRQALRTMRARVAAVSPIIDGAPVKGPLHHMLKGLGYEVSPVGVARLYRGLADVFVFDRRDAALAPRIAELGMRPVITETLMTSTARSRRLAATVLSELRQ